MISSKKLLTTIFLALQSVSAQTDAEKAAYPFMAAGMEEFGYVWESHKVTTDDNWVLTLYRIYGYLEEDGVTVTIPSELPENADKDPILAQHGAGGNGHGFAAATYNGEKNLFMRLVDRGYDVWVGNSRGSEYSNENTQDDTWSLEERWNYTWADMGINDIPANIEKILTVTGKQKVTLVGHSQGTSQSYYGLAKQQDYFAERVSRFIAFASCIQRSYYGDSDQVLTDFTRMFDVYNYYNFNYYDQDAVTALPSVLCDDDEVSEVWCGFAYGALGQSIMSEFYTA